MKALAQAGSHTLMPVLLQLQDEEQPVSVPRLRLELKKALAEKEALERRLKLLLGRQRASYLPQSASAFSQSGPPNIAGSARGPVASSRPLAAGLEGAGRSPQTPSQVPCRAPTFTPFPMCMHACSDSLLEECCLIKEQMKTFMVSYKRAAAADECARAAAETWRIN